ncbi:hypothetical protein C8Q75DRAFT_812156 [Abortiporus biennis]|nr:hypothetical protein C8Q75DRAFT_812156 [Abortiporus biennis]
MEPAPSPAPAHSPAPAPSPAHAHAPAQPATDPRIQYHGKYLEICAGILKAITSGFRKKRPDSLLLILHTIRSTNWIVAVNLNMRAIFQFGPEEEAHLALLTARQPVPPPNDATPVDAYNYTISIKAYNHFLSMVPHLCYKWTRLSFSFFSYIIWSYCGLSSTKGIPA